MRKNEELSGCPLRLVRVGDFGAIQTAARRFAASCDKVQRVTDLDLPSGKHVAAELRDYRNYVHPEKERRHWTVSLLAGFDLL